MISFVWDFRVLCMNHGNQPAGKVLKNCSSVTGLLSKGLAGHTQIAAKRFKTRQAKSKLLLFYYYW